MSNSKTKSKKPKTFLGLMPKKRKSAKRKVTGK